MTNGNWEKGYEDAMNAVAPPGRVVKKELVKSWVRGTARFHKDLPLSYRIRLEHHENMLRRYDNLVYKHAVKASREEMDSRGFYKSNTEAGFSRGAYHERLADKYRELAAKHALKIIHLEQKLGKPREELVRAWEKGVSK